MLIQNFIKNYWICCLRSEFELQIFLTIFYFFFFSLNEIFFSKNIIFNFSLLFSVMVSWRTNSVDIINKSNLLSRISLQNLMKGYFFNKFSLYFTEIYWKYWINVCENTFKTQSVSFKTAFEIFNQGWIWIFFKEFTLPYCKQKKSRVKFFSLSNHVLTMHY
jgi:hypothetical protein